MDVRTNQAAGGRPPGGASGSGRSPPRGAKGPGEQGWGPDGSAGGAGRHAP